MKLIKSKTFLTIFLFCLVASVMLAILNLAQLEKYRISRRNNTRKDDINAIINGVKSYLANSNNNLPTTSNPDEKSFLPELIIVDKNPTGGVTTSTLENMQGYFDLNTKDPSGSPYYIGTFAEQIIVYTTNLEVYNEKNETYFVSYTIPVSEPE